MLLHYSRCLQHFGGATAVQFDNFTSAYLSVSPSLATLASISATANVYVWLASEVTRR